MNQKFQIYESIILKLEMHSDNNFLRLKNTILALNGFLDLKIFQKYAQFFSKDFVQILENIVKIKKGSTRAALLKAVSLELNQIEEKNWHPVLERMTSTRKTQRTRAYIGFLIPTTYQINQIENIRAKVIVKIRKEELIEPHQLQPLLELYHILNFSMMEINSDLEHHAKFQNMKSLKQKLTSLKKMMGGGTQLEEEEKKEKKIAYLRNLEMRQILMDIAGRISNRKEGERLKTLLEIPKNKKWIGSRFHKLLLENNWKRQQISYIYNGIQEYINQNRFQKQKKSKKIKTHLRNLMKNLEKMLKSSLENGENGSEMVGESDEIQSLISVNYSSFSVGEVRLFEGSDYENEEENFNMME